MFLIREASDASILRLVEQLREAPFSYGEVGASRGGPERLAGYAVDHNRREVGRGDSAFDRAVEALHRWKMFDIGWIRLLPPDAPVEVGSTVAVLARHYGLSSLNFCRVAYVIDEAGGPVRRRGFAYGTLEEHAQSGEERFTVEQHGDGRVFYDLYAFSRPSHPLSRCGRPVARAIQRRFARDSLQAMSRAAGVMY